MQKESAQILIEFENKAGRLFAFYDEQFEKVLAKLNREHDENVFQQMAARHIKSFKQQLIETALDLIRQHEKNTSGSLHIQHALTARIQYYEKEFSRKIKQ